MNEEITQLIEYWELAKKSWNFNADELNQWENLSFEEKSELLLSTIRDNNN